MQQPPPMGGAPQYQVPQKKSKGCFFWGIIVLLVVLVGAGGCVALGFYFIRNQLLRFTSTEQIAVQKYTPAPGEYEALQERIDAFSKAADEGAPQRLEITQDDLNAFIAGNPKMDTLEGKVYARIKGSEVLLDVSFPLDGIPTLGGRYFNGTLGVKLAIVEGRLVVFPETAQVNGEDVPEQFMARVRQEDLFKNQRQQGDVAEFLKKAKSLEVEGGKIILTR